MSNAQTILKALQKTIVGTSTEEIKTAENILKSFQNSDDFIDNIALILEQSQVNPNVQKAAAIYLNKHANSVVKSRNQILINNIAQKILKLLTNYKVNIKNKIIISRSLQSILAADKSKIIRSAFQPNLLSILAQSEQQNDQNINFEFLVFFGQILMGNAGFTEQVWKFISKSFILFVKLTIRIQNLLEQILLTNNRQLAEKLLILTREYLYLLRLYLKRFLFIDVEANKLLYIPQIQTVITKALQIQLSNNQLSFPIFHLSQSSSPQQKILNQIKSNCISFLNHFTKTLVGMIKEPKLLELNPTFAKTNEYLVTMISASQQIMKRQPYYKIKDLSALNSLDQVYSFYTTTIRANAFYQIFVQYKSKMIQDLIFRALVLTPKDYQNYYQNPEEFLNTLIHIIERDVKVKQRKQIDQQEDQIQSFNTLRTHAAQFLSHFCKYQDGTLTEIIQYGLLILEGKLNSQFSPSLMLIVMAILRDISKERRDIHALLSGIITKLLNQMQIPKKKTEQPQSNSKKNQQLDIQYSLVLLLLSKTFSKIQMVNPKIIDFSFKLCYKILNDEKVQEVPKLIVLDIIQGINHLQEGEPYSPEVLKTFNSLLKAHEKPSQKLLEAYYSLIKYNDVMLKQKCYNQLIDMINTLAMLIKKQVQNPNKQQILINKLWNVIRQVGENSEFIPLMIEPIQNAIMPLLPYVDGFSENDFQEDILMLMSAFISKSRSVTMNQLKMFEIIPRIFYNQYKGIFGHSFQTMQTFIYYGKEIIKTSPAAINQIIKMAIVSITNTSYNGRQLLESDSCQGALLLQSLIIGCGLSIQTKAYEQIVESVRNRLKTKIKYNLLKANLVALQALVLIHSCQNFTNQINDIILSDILNQISSFEKVKHAPKILIIALNQLLVKYQNQFVSRRYVQILDTMITLLQMISMKKESLFEEEEDDQQRDYENSLLQTTNDLIKMDEFQDFKNQIKILKQQNLQLIQATVNQLPSSKKDFLKNVLAVQRVSNEPRKIFKINRNK